MPDPLRPLRLDARELLRAPGSTHRVERRFSPGDLDVEHEAIRGDVEVDLAVDVTGDAIDVTGEIRAARHGRCRRCLREIDAVATAEVDERYRPDLGDAAPTTVDVDGRGDDESYPIENGRLDLVPMTRELILLELDDEQTCRDDCAGLCPVCGLDRNENDCSCDTTVRDERWAALDALVVDE